MQKEHDFFDSSLGNMSNSNILSLVFVNYNLIVFTRSQNVISSFSRSILFDYVIPQVYGSLTADLFSLEHLSNKYKKCLLLS